MTNTDVKASPILIMKRKLLFPLEIIHRIMLCSNPTELILMLPIFPEKEVIPFLFSNVSIDFPECCFEKLIISIHNSKLIVGLSDDYVHIEYALWSDSLIMAPLITDNVKRLDFRIRSFFPAYFGSLRDLLPHCKRLRHFSCLSDIVWPIIAPVCTIYGQSNLSKFSSDSLKHLVITARRLDDTGVSVLSTNGFPNLESLQIDVNNEPIEVLHPFSSLRKLLVLRCRNEPDLTQFGGIEECFIEYDCLEEPASIGDDRFLVGSNFSVVSQFASPSQLANPLLLAYPSQEPSPIKPIFPRMIKSLKRLILREVNYSRVSLESAPNLEYIELYLGMTREIVLSSLKALKKLRITGGLLKAIPIIKSLFLEELVINNSRIEEIGPKFYCLNIKKMDLSSNEIKELRIPILPRLMTLDVSSNQISRISSDSRFPSVETLRIDGNPLVWINLAHFPRLKLFSANVSRITCLSVLEASSTLEKASLKECLLNEGPKVSEGHTSISLKALDISGCVSFYISGSVRSQIWNHRFLYGLQELDISNTDVRSLKGIKKLSSLRKLIFRNSRLTLLNGLDFKGVQHLEMLEVSNCSNLLVFNMENLPLSILILNDNGITDTSEIRHLPNVSFVDLSNNRISTIKGLYGLPHLQLMDLRFNKIKKIAKLQTRSHKFQVLLEGNPVTL